MVNSSFQSPIVQETSETAGPRPRGPGRRFRRSLFSEVVGTAGETGAWIAVVLTLIASARIVSTYTVFNHTSDEPAHIACGMEWLDKGVYRWEPHHPPLARVATALGPYLLGIRSQGTDPASPLAMLHEGAAILYREHHYDLTLAVARLGILPLLLDRLSRGLLVGQAIFWRSRASSPCSSSPRFQQSSPMPGWPPPTWRSRRCWACRSSPE